MDTIPLCSKRFYRASRKKIPSETIDKAAVLPRFPVERQNNAVDGKTIAIRASRAWADVCTIGHNRLELKSFQTQPTVRVSYMLCTNYRKAVSRAGGLGSSEVFGRQAHGYLWS
jgi:hypothetical protein